jgi:hypothetical protein
LHLLKRVVADRSLTPFSYCASVGSGVAFVAAEGFRRRR